MRIKRFIAPDMRSALRLVREEQGPDAVILSNRQTEGGVEVVAATDYDEALVHQALRSMGTPAQPDAPAAKAAVATVAVAAPPAPAKATAPSGHGRAVFRIGDGTEVEAAPRAPAQADVPGPAPGLVAVATAERTPGRLEQMMAAFMPARTTQVAAPAQAAAPRAPMHAASSNECAAPASVVADQPTAEARPQPRIDVRVDDAEEIPSFAEALAKIAAPLPPATPAPRPAALDDQDACAPQPEPLRVQAACVQDAATARAGDLRQQATCLPSRDAAASLRLVEADPAVAALRAELSAMRQVIERELGQFAVERLRGSPARAAAMDALTTFGCDEAFAQQIAARIDPTLPTAAIAAPLRAELAALLPLIRDEPLEDGGVIALLGPTGAGKTTTIAKLAARFAARHRARDVALVTTDTERTGAREQLHALGRRLGITVCDADGPDGLSRALDQLADYPLVLVDTAGYGLRDRALLRQILWVRASSRVRSLLVLPANAHPGDLNELLRRYRPAAPEGVVLTKLDESVCVGAALSVLVQHGLPLAYTSSGQHVPDDIEPADAHRLAQALDPARGAADAPDNDRKDDSRHACA